MGFMPEKLKSSIQDAIAARRLIKQAETSQTWLDERAVEKGVINTPSGLQRKFWVVPSPGTGALIQVLRGKV